MSWETDDRIVLTLDAGGTNFAFSAVQRGREIADPIVLPAEANNLEASLSNLILGFERLTASAPRLRSRSVSPFQARPTIRAALSTTSAICPPTAAESQWDRCSPITSACRCS